jgi:hypothetical protein
MSNHKPGIWKPNETQRKNVFNNTIKLCRYNFHFHIFSKTE